MSSASDPILDCLDELKPFGVRKLTLVHVMEVGYVNGLPVAYAETFEDLLRRRAIALMDKGFEVQACIRFGSPAEEILRVAKGAQADLVVVGSRGHSVAFDLLIGSTSKKVLETAAIPVLLERVELSGEGTRADCEVVCRRKTTTVLLATDLTEEAKGAETTMAVLLDHVDRGVLLHVDRGVLLHVTDENADSDKLGGPSKQLAELAAGMPGGCDKLSIVIEKGAPVEAVARVATKERVTLVIVGRHDGTWLGQHISKRLSEAICETVRAPVLIIPPLGRR